MAVPGTYIAGQSGDDVWEEILADFNAQSVAQYGVPMNRPWGSDVDSLRSYGDLSDKYNARNAEIAAAQAAAAGTTTSGEGGEEEGGGGEWTGELVDSGWTGYADNAYTSPNSREIYNLVSEQIAYTSRRLNEIEAARAATDMTGTLTSAEKAMFDEMEASAVSNLKSQTKKETEEVWDTAIADLINRGVLQGTVGETILSEIGSESLNTVTEGVNTIRANKNAQMLATISDNKKNALTWQSLLMTEAQGLLGVGTTYSGQQTTATIEANNNDLTNVIAELNASVQLQGYESAEAIAALSAETQSAIAALNAKTSYDLGILNANTTKYGYDLDAATRLAIANDQSNASVTASKWGAVGSGSKLLYQILRDNNNSDWWDSNYDDLSSGSTTSLDGF